MTMEFQGEAIEWRGPAPFVFVPVPPDLSAEIKAMSSRLTYGWGCIPVTARFGETTVTTALIPRQGVYLVPVKMMVQKAEKVGVGDEMSVRLEFKLNPF